MRKDMDKIVFERRSEIEELMIVLSEYCKQNPKSEHKKNMEKLMDQLEVMHMEW